MKKGKSRKPWDKSFQKTPSSDGGEVVITKPDKPDRVRDFINTCLVSTEYGQIKKVLRPEKTYSGGIVIDTVTPGTELKFKIKSSHFDGEITMIGAFSQF